VGWKSAFQRDVLSFSGVLNFVGEDYVWKIETGLMKSGRKRSRRKKGKDKKREGCVRRRKIGRRGGFFIISLGRINQEGPLTKWKIHPIRSHKQMNLILNVDGHFSGASEKAESTRWFCGRATEKDLNQKHVTIEKQINLISSNGNTNFTLHRSRMQWIFFVYKYEWAVCNHEPTEKSDQRKWKTSPEWITDFLRVRWHLIFAKCASLNFTTR
jgi:hypothetical protein